MAAVAKSYDCLMMLPDTLPGDADEGQMPSLMAAARIRSGLSRTMSAGVGVAIVFMVLTGGSNACGAAQGDAPLIPFDEKTSSYAKAKDTSPIARLQERIDQGEVKLRHDDKCGYLLSLLDELKVSTN